MDAGAVHHNQLGRNFEHAINQAIKRRCLCDQAGQIIALSPPDSSFRITLHMNSEGWCVRNMTGSHEITHLLTIPSSVAALHQFGVMPQGSTVQPVKRGSLGSSGGSPWGGGPPIAPALQHMIPACSVPGLARRPEMRVMFAVAVLASANPTAAQEQPKFLGGGPFLIKTDSAVICSNPDAALIANATEGEYGRAEVGRALTFGRCYDAPRGTLLLILNYNSRLAMVMPDVRGPNRVGFIASQLVESTTGTNLADNQVFLRFPRKTWNQASQHGRDGRPNGDGR